MLQKFLIMQSNPSISKTNQLLIPVLVDLYNWMKKGLQKISKVGMYEVLDFETTLEILDPKGKHAIVRKTEGVKFLQDNIIAFQDQAWGAGKILLNYKCNPGIPVDFYPLGHKTHILISLREVKNRGDIVKFNIQWGIKNGFLKHNGFWANDINHFTKSLKVTIVLPTERPPIKLVVIETNSQRTCNLPQDTFIQLPDGRWQITWEKHNPKINDHYILKWTW
jgi:hypothetical protein